MKVDVTLSSILNILSPDDGSKRTRLRFKLKGRFGNAFCFAEIQSNGNLGSLHIFGARQVEWTSAYGFRQSSSTDICATGGSNK